MLRLILIGQVIGILMWLVLPLAALALALLMAYGANGMVATARGIP